MPLSAFSKMLFACEQTSSKLEKLAAVKAALDGPYGKDIEQLLRFAISPLIRFGVRDIPSSAPPSIPAAEPDIRLVFVLLEKLASRALTGHAALDAISKMFAYLPGGGDVSAREALRRILRKDLRAGFDANTVNKAQPGLIPSFPYMRCSLAKDVDLAKWDWATGVTSQEKADGMFANLDIDEIGDVTISSRQGTEFPLSQFSDLVAEARDILKRGTQSHGELLVKRSGVVLPREIGNGILNSVAKGGSFGANERPIYLVWDQIPLDDAKPKGKSTRPYRSRLYDLREQIAGDLQFIGIIDTRIVHSVNDAYAHYREMLAKGKEGTIIKEPDATWRDGTSKQQVKLKLEVVVELEIVGFVPGEGKNASTFGSLLCRSSCGKLEVAVSGMSDATRASLYGDETTVGKIIAVCANAIMSPSSSNPLHSLFLPRWVEERLDKSEADTLDSIISQFENAMKG